LLALEGGHRVLLLGFRSRCGAGVSGLDNVVIDVLVNRFGVFLACPSFSVFLVQLGLRLLIVV